MTRRKIWGLCLTAVFWVGSLMMAPAQQPSSSPVPAYIVTVMTDRADAMYRIGEPVVFTVTVTRDGTAISEGEVDWALTKDGIDPSLQSGKTPLKDGRALITGQLPEPGFLQCKIGFKTDKESVRGLGAAAVDPLEIKPSLPVPDDFDAFWKAKKEELAKVALNAKLTPLRSAVPGAELFEVEADSVGDKPMRGLLARPIGAKPKSLPAIISLEGAGIYSTRLEPWLMSYAKEGFLSLEVSAHGLPNGKPDDFYQELERGSMKDYQWFGRTSRDSFYFLNMYLRDLQGVNFLAAQPEWDGRVMIANGISQGGAQAIFVAAEDPRITFLMAAVPAMCDHSGMVAGRVPGWPRLVPNAPNGKPDPTILETSRYFDSVNFASRVKVPVLFAVGFLDQITPPTSVYASYNNIPSKKEMVTAVLSPHRLNADVIEEIRKKVLLQK